MISSQAQQTWTGKTTGEKKIPSFSADKGDLQGSFPAEQKKEYKSGEYSDPPGPM